jgi:hypothetical protein
MIALRFAGELHFQWRKQMSISHLDHSDALGVVHVVKRPYVDPIDVANDHGMTPQEKREVLADWASDRRAVLDHPPLRRLDSGHLVEIDAVLDALKRLDGIEGDVTRPTSSKQSRYSRPLWPWDFRNDDDNDDPPHCPAAATPRKPRPFLDATRALMVA